ncbi:MAG: replication-relaxation family protein [Hyphomicrobiaceae bacterium]
MTDVAQPRCRYRPRRRRSGNPLPLQVTPRDIDILRAVARFRFLNSGHITTLLPGSARNMRARLKLMFEHGLLDRPECQYDTYRPGGCSAEIVYALADKGARMLAKTGHPEIAGIAAWSQKNRAAGRPFLEHTLAVADFAVSLHASVRSRDDIVLLDDAALITRFPAPTCDLPNPLRISVPVILDGTRHVIGIEPDYAFSLGLPALRQRANYLVEIDRGTMPIERSGLAASSILRKLITYREIWRSGLHTSQFGWRKFRVLTVTTEAERAKHMRECALRHLGPTDASLFWFTDRTTLEQIGSDPGADRLSRTCMDRWHRQLSIDFLCLIVCASRPVLCICRFIANRPTALAQTEPAGGLCPPGVDRWRKNKRPTHEKRGPRGGTRDLEMRSAARPSEVK